MAGLVAECEAVAEEPVVATSGREVLVGRAGETQLLRQALKGQQSHHQAWEVCILAAAEWATSALETLQSSGVDRTRR